MDTAPNSVYGVESSKYEKEYHDKEARQRQRAVVPTKADVDTADKNVSTPTPV